ncbi:MAG TPA: sulfatase [Tepidisphaeraceae bacterium]|nr:sulfatase [Tepidisphaeraceae bacterium]
MRRRLTLLLSYAIALSTTAAVAADKPNVLLFFVDDMGAADLGCFGSDLYRTPHLDKLAAQGAKFTRAYASAPVCSPTRAALLTGKAPARLHLTDWLRGGLKPYAKLRVPDWTMGLPETEPTLGTMLKANGYATAWLGKWHLGGDTQAFGFDAGNQDWEHNRKDDPADVKGAFTLNAEAQKFIQAAGGKPFFVAISHYSPHGPIRFDPKLRDEYQKLIDQKKPRQTNAGYAAMIEALDTSVGRMLTWLDGRGLAEKTLVIFTSDNGGVSSFTNNYPLREQKGTLYEGGVRVPMIARWPGHIPTGSTNTTRFASADLLPTLAVLTAATPPKDIDGQDLSTAFQTGESLNRGPLYWHYPHYHNGKPAGAILAGDLKLIEWFETGETELYDLSTDPSEQTDLSAKQPEAAAKLLADLKAWRTKVGAQMPTANPNHDAAREKEGPPKKPKPAKGKKAKDDADE